MGSKCSILFDSIFINVKSFRPRVVIARRGIDYADSNCPAKHRCELRHRICARASVARRDSASRKRKLREMIPAAALL